MQNVNQNFQIFHYSKVDPAQIQEAPSLSEFRTKGLKVKVNALIPRFQSEALLNKKENYNNNIHSEKTKITDRKKKEN